MNKILIVDDELFIVEGLKAYFELDGFEVITASNGREAIEMAKSQKPDLIMLDIMMPDLNGWQTLKMLKEDESTKEIQVIMSSVMGKDEDIEKSISLGASDYIVKSNDADKIVEKIKEILSKM